VLRKDWVRDTHCIDPEIDYGVFELRRVGVPANTLRKSGFLAEELRKGGYTEEELRRAGYTE
jgi:hypothetical protein